MKMFEEGGLKEEGGMVDDVSGNDVPIGSTREEVRDDIPAQLSEGEFVFPADVVRFIGLEKLMMLRQEAKAGLKRMEEMGQMGNSEEATLPDDMPFDMDDLDLEEEGEVTDSNFNRGGIVSMAEGGTIPTTENTDLINNTQDSVVQPITQQRTTIQQKPLNVRQQAVPIRGMVTNIPKAEDFLKRKPTDATKTPNFASIAPTNIGSRFTDILDISKQGVEQKKQSIADVKKELDAVLETPSSDGGDSESTSGVQSGGLDYASVDRFALDDNLRDVFNDFSKAQLSMFSVAASNPFTVMASGIGTSLADKTKGFTAFGPINTAELGKIQAKAFHQVALDVTNKYGVTSLNDLSAAGQKELATQGRVTMDFAKDIYSASKGMPYSSFSFNEDDKKGFLDTAKNVVNSVLSIGKTTSTTSMPSPEIADKQKGMANLMTTIKDLASKSQVTKQNEKMLNTVLGAVSASQQADVEDFGVTPNLDEFGFNNDAKSDVAANGGSKGIGYNSNGTSYSINNNGTYTHSNGTTTNVTDSKGNPINSPPTPEPDKTSVSPSSISTETFGGDTGDPGDGGGPTGDPDDDDSANTDVTSSSVAGPGTVSMSTDPNDNNDNNDNGDGGDGGDGGGGGGGGGSHICTATYNTGYIEKDHFKTLKKYGVMLRKTDPYMMKAYDVFGPKIASLVHTNKYVTSLAKFLTAYYKNVMLKKPLSIKQKMFKILSVGLLRPLWRLIGRFM